MDADLRALTDGSAAADSGVPRADLLVHFAEAAVDSGPGVAGGCHDDPDLVEAREKLRAELGPEALVDAAAVVANFQRMDRIADATGIPLDTPVDLMTADLRERLGIDRYAAAASSARSNPVKRALAGVLRGTATAALRLLPRR